MKKRNKEENRRIERREEKNWRIKNEEKRRI